MTYKKIVATSPSEREESKEPLFVMLEKTTGSKSYDIIERAILNNEYKGGVNDTSKKGGAAPIHIAILFDRLEETVLLLCIKNLDINIKYSELSTSYDYGTPYDCAHYVNSKTNENKTDKFLKFFKQNGSINFVEVIRQLLKKDRTKALHFLIEQHKDSKLITSKELSELKSEFPTKF
ncbi:MAG: hypothetical protein HRT90_00785 [Candidatus Margulisbacteria bacterium]|nr:hypothetical protein [Candidatus Margulisiibacteriota bacterium]